MKIKKDDDVYIFPLNEQINILVDNQFKSNMISCLTEYFGKNKKSSCQIYDDYNQKVLYDEFNFVYIPYHSNIDNNLDFKEKSIMNINVAKLFEENTEMFKSIEMIRENLFNLLTDKGMYSLKKILSRGLNKTIDIQVSDFDIFKIIQMIGIVGTALTEEEKYLIVYNMMLYLNRDKNTVVYIDFPVGVKTVEWLNSLNDKNVIFIIENILSMEAIELIRKCALIKMSNKNYLEVVENDILELKEISYMFNPLISSFISLQNEKIINLYNQFDDEETTFYLVFSELNSKNAFI